MPAKRPGRPRTLDRKKKTQICDLVAGGAKLGAAAVAVGVSTRTIQRQILRDPEFDQELRLCQATPADPLRLMQSAARTHWRAAAWLLERENPEHYGRRSPSSCSPRKFEAALNTVLEAALEATPPEQQAEVYEHVRAACKAAFARVFPTYGPCGQLIEPRLPATPLADAAHWRRACDPRRAVRDYDDESRQINIPVPEPQRPSPQAPRTCAGGEDAPARVPNTTSPGARLPSPQSPDPRLPWHYVGRVARTASPIFDEPISSPKTHLATESRRDNNQSPEEPGAHEV